MTKINFTDPNIFSELLYEKMLKINIGIADLELYEFRYALENIVPSEGWDSTELESMDEIEQKINNKQFYTSIQLKPRKNNKMVMDEKILRLAQMLFAGLVSGEFSPEWINQHFYFDIRGFYFIPRTEYFSEKSRQHLGGEPYQQFDQKQKNFAGVQSIGYKAFQTANTEIDQCFIKLVQKLVTLKGTPILIAIAGQTAAGKTEIVSRLQRAFENAGQEVTTIEIDNFLTDRDYREEKGIDSKGQDALHYAVFKQCLQDICEGKKISTPRYNFVLATSSHTPQGELKEGCSPIEIEPADIIFIEGNFPFLMPEIAHLIGIKTVYLTDDAIRLKRKWKRDMDYRKKYDLMYFLNRYFREQYIMAEAIYTPQMEICDMVIDTTRAAIWTTPQIKNFLDSNGETQNK